MGGGGLGGGDVSEGGCRGGEGGGGEGGGTLGGLGGADGGGSCPGKKGGGGEGGGGKGGGGNGDGNMDKGGNDGVGGVGGGDTVGTERVAAVRARVATGFCDLQREVGPAGELAVALDVTDDLGVLEHRGQAVDDRRELLDDVHVQLVGVVPHVLAPPRHRAQRGLRQRLADL